jgi:hypothetical protein
VSLNTLLLTKIAHVSKPARKEKSSASGLALKEERARKAHPRAARRKAS